MRILKFIWIFISPFVKWITKEIKHHYKGVLITLSIIAFWICQALYFIKTVPVTSDIVCPNGKGNHEKGKQLLIAFFGLPLLELLGLGVLLLLFWLSFLLIVEITAYTKDCWRESKEDKYGMAD